MIPTVEAIFLPAQDMVALAAATTRARLDLRGEPTESNLVRSLFRHDPPHLTCAEHARFAVLTPRFGLPTVEQFAGRNGLRYEVRSDATAVLGVNLSHIRAMALDWHPQLGRSLAALFRPYAPAVLGDIVGDDVVAPAYLRLAQEGEFTPAERRTFPIRSFRITCSRVASHEFVTHRSISKEQESQRVTVPNGFIWPPVLAASRAAGCGSAEEVDEWERDAIRLYNELRVAHGWKREDARYVLPGATATRILFTADVGWWREFLYKRGQRGAQDEIRYLALLIHEALAESCPEAVEGIDVDTAGLAPWLAQREVPA